MSLIRINIVGQVWGTNAWSMTHIPGGSKKVGFFFFCFLFFSYRCYAAEFSIYVQLPQSTDCFSPAARRQDTSTSERHGQAANQTSGNLVLISISGEIRTTLKIRQRQLIMFQSSWSNWPIFATNTLNMALNHPFCKQWVNVLILLKQ